MVAWWCGFVGLTRGNNIILTVHTTVHYSLCGVDLSVLRWWRAQHLSEPSFRLPPLTVRVTRHRCTRMAQHVPQRGTDSTETGEFFFKTFISYQLGRSRLLIPIGTVPYSILDPHCERPWCHLVLSGGMSGDTHAMEIEAGAAATPIPTATTTPDVARRGSVESGEGEGDGEGRGTDSTGSTTGAPDASSPRPPKIRSVVRRRSPSSQTLSFPCSFSSYRTVVDDDPRVHPTLRSIHIHFSCSSV